MASKRKIYSFLKRSLIILLMLLITFSGYVAIVTRNSKNMTIRQRILKSVYPAFMWFTKLTGKNVTQLSNEQKLPPVSFYSLKTTANNGSEVDFSQFKGKKILLVNTASDCGYTDQYDALQKLYEENKDSLIILGFPANDFKEQEKGTDEEIAQFCKLNYGVTFPLMKKSSVVKGAEQNPVFKWLTDSALNGWNTKPPSWNFGKYLVNEEGILTNYFGSSVSPASTDIINAIKN
jgi:glutathione peroxidase